MIGSNTSSVNMITLQVAAEDQIAIDKQIIVDSATGQSLYDSNQAADNAYYIWKGDLQTIPMGMDGEPEQYATRLAQALPNVTTLRLPFNEFSFNPDGSLHDQYERFLVAAVAEGFDINFVYAGGLVQQLGNPGAAGYSALTNTQAFNALQANFTDVTGAWDDMLDWLDAHASVKTGVFGFDLMNEPAGYRHSIHLNGNGEGYVYADFVQLYADHIIALSDQIQARMDGNILVGPWRYSGDIATLDETMIGSQSAIEYIQSGVGADLVWSVHLYPGWAGTHTATTPAELEAILDAHFAPLAGQNVLVTETHAHGLVDNPDSNFFTDALLVQSYEWFAENGIGLGWFPGTEAGGSNLVVIDGDGTLRYLHQHSLAHAMNAFSMGDAPIAPTGNEVINATLIAAKLRNEDYEVDYDPAAKFDAAQFIGTAYGYDGHDRLIGSALSNDFLYGGTGNDTLTGDSGDDFLFGQYGNDLLSATSGINHFFGGDGDDTLIGGSNEDIQQGGKGHDDLSGNAGNDALTGNEGSDTLRGGAGFDWLEGGDGADLLDGGDQADNLLGGSGNDTLLGGNGFDRLFGQDGEDILYGGNTFDSLYGQIGNDRMFGQNGNDGMWGGQGNDFLDGGAGDDWMIGGAGFDTLLGSTGNDIMAGAFNADIFVFADFGGGFGQDTIRDFDANNNFEKIDLSRVSGIRDFTDLVNNHMNQVGADVVINDGSGNSITLQNVLLGDLLDGNDFLF